MKDDILNGINEQKYLIKDDKIIEDIVNRTTAKFFDKSNEEIVLFDMKDYVISQLTWKKQSLFTWLPAVLLKCSERLCEDFMALDSDYNDFNKATCYRDVYSELY